MNVVNVIGRWTKEHEKYHVGENGTLLVKNTIAVDHPFKKDSTAFLRVNMWAKTGELASTYTTKGTQVAIEGHLETGSYDDKDGKRVFTVDIVADRVTFIDSRYNTQQDSPRMNAGSRNEQVGINTRSVDTNENKTFGEIDDDDLPF